MTNENSSIPRIRFIGDGTTTRFNFFFKIFEASNIRVYFTDEEKTSGFAVSFDKEMPGGEVTFDEAPADGTIITLTRDLDIKRTALFSESQIFRTEMLNQEFDYHIACLEQLADGLNRTISFPINMPSEIDASLPYPEPGKALMWNAQGNKLTTSRVDIENLNAVTGEIIEMNQEIKADMEEIKGISDSITQIGENIPQLIASKADADLSNAAENIDYVIESWTSADGRSWYRKYRSGRSEQGGYVASTATVNLLLPLVNTSYIVFFGAIGTTSNGVPRIDSNYKTKTSFIYTPALSGGSAAYWMVIGQYI